jgi:hypothetical protein
MSSIFLVTRGTTIPSLVLEENGVALPGTQRIDFIGSGFLGYRSGSFWRLTPDLTPGRTASPLLPSSTYVVKDVHSSPVETVLTQFTTAATYDKAPGQAPVLTALRLWRVHYPADQIGGGSCVFSEYVGYVDLDYQDGVVPGTPAEEVVGVIQLTSRTVGEFPPFVFAGSHFEGVMDGAGDVPHDGIWKPMLAPDAEYCATMTLYGRNDRAMPAVISNQICAEVHSVDTAGGAGALGGCSFGGRHPLGCMAALLTAFGLALARRARRPN